MHNLFNEMERLGLVSTNSTWLERAIRTQPGKVSIELARSIPVRLDAVDKFIYLKEIRN